MSEAQEQVLLFQWAKMQENVYPELKLLFHIPNGGKRNLKEVEKARAKFLANLIETSVVKGEVDV